MFYVDNQNCRDLREVTAVKTATRYSEDAEILVSGTIPTLLLGPNLPAV